MPQFQLTNVYDAPTLALSQVVDGEVSGRGIVGTLFDPARLSPAERETYAERLKKAAGGGSVTNAIVDVLSNPFTWLFIATTPFAASAAVRAGAPMFRAGADVVASARTRFPFLGAIGLLAPAELLADMHLPAIARKAKQVSDEVKMGAITRLRDAQLEAEAGLGHSLDTTALPQGSQKWQRALMVNRAMMMMRGAHATWEESIPIIKDGVWGVTRRVNKAEVDEKAVMRFLSDAVGGEQAARRLLTAHDEVYKWGFEETLSTPSKRLARWRLAVNPSTVGVDDETFLGAGIAREGLKRAWAARGTPEYQTVLDDIDRVIIGADRANPYYMPRVLAKSYANGLEIPAGAGGEAVQVRRVSGVGSSISREVKHSLFTPEDYAAMHEAGWLTDEGVRKMGLSQKLAREGTPGAPTRLIEANATKAFDRYVMNMAKVRALADPLDEDLLYANDVAHSHYGKTPIYAEQGGMSPIAMYRDGKAVMPVTRKVASDIPVKESVRSLIAKGVEPPGGWTAGDLLYLDYLHVGAGEFKPGMPNVVSKSRTLLMDYAIPRLAGRMPDDAAAMGLMVDAGKRGIGAVAKTLGPFIKQVGPHGEALVKKMEDYASTEGMPGAGMTASRGIAKWLYSTHLGLNPTSPLINLMQPLTAGPIVGYGNLAAAYPEAVKQMTNYFNSSIKMLGKAESRVEKNARILKHIPLAEEAGITRAIFDVEDTLKQSGNNDIFEWFMKAFEKSEWFNRLVTAHAVGKGMKWSGTMESLTPAIKAQMRTATEQINFAADWWSTPTIFGEGVLANPLLKQFMTFPTRMLTSALYSNPNLVAGGGKGLANFARAMGFSAIVYEAAKGLFGTDVSRGLTWASTTDIVPFMSGGRYDNRKSIVPVPPVIDVPTTAIRGLIEGDTKLLQESLPRLIPGGVGLSKLLNVAPDWVGPDILQKTYIDPESRTSTGEMALRKSDGSLVEWVDPTTLVMRSLGVGGGQWQNASQRDQYLVKQRDEIVRYQQQFTQQVLANNVAASTATRAEFQRRFGIPLTITKQQLESAHRQREQIRGDRILDRMSAQAKPLYQSLVAAPTGGQGTMEAERTRIPQQQETAPEESTSPSAFGAF